MIVTVEHALIKENGEEFQPRGTITIRSLKHKTGVFYQNDHLSREDLQVLKDMAQNDAYYRIRVPARFSTDVDEPQIYVSTYVNACALLQSKFTETIIVSIDHLGNIYGVGLRLPVSQCEDSRRFSDVPSYFNTTVQILQQTAGALPDTQTYVQRLEKEKAEEAAGKGKDNRSFLAKYWMYIVPVVIFMLMTSQQGGDQHREKEKASPSDSSRVNKWESPTHTSTSVAPSEDVTSSYRYACERSRGTYFQLVSSCPELSQEDGSSTFQAGKAYFEAFDSNRGESSSSSNDLETKINEISQSSDFESSRIASSTKVEFETFTIESESKSSSALDVTKSTMMSSLTSQITTTTHETTTTQYVQEATSETYQSSSDHYGETDWYMDILLRMQALDMKQQSLLVQYDFLGKLANENREDLNQARDWARYESDMSQIEVY
ncbi:hypothetical protein QZH41_003717 [Actinostola sp. cb2023]|nr:hypothetical protein QZH41_003717 [Actinostola sp. cb2023]